MPIKRVPPKSTIEKPVL
jgi:hypothetical protein